MIGGRVLVALAVMAAVGCTGSDNHGPDGRILLFDGFGVSAISVDGGPATRLRLRPEPWGGLAYFPDGKRIAYDAIDGIHVADADGSNARRIPGQPSVHDHDPYANPSWSPDGERIVLERNESLYAISPDNGDPEYLGGGSTPRWSPDGRIVFTRGYDQNRVFADIVVMGADGGGRKVLARGDYVDVSPDGRMLAYSGPGGTEPAANKRAVYVMPLDGGERRRITDDGYAPIWSPDGDYLAFTRVTQCGHAVCSGRIFVMPVDGGEAHPVSRLIGDPGGAIAWTR
jgi:Tol biopolymer transport system component